MIEFGNSSWHAGTSEAIMGASIRRLFLKGEEPFSRGARFPQGVLAREIQCHFVGKIGRRDGEAYAVAGVVQERE